ncbi:MAG TPA: hypothetical protein VK069_06275 [Mycolicibacillus parakoreensis]|nr:hypothetical protein [Mycolicibacillus parakoreensis]
MSMTRSLLTATAVVVGTSTAMLTGGVARADTAPAPNPTPPAVPAIEQLANLPATAPMMLQDVAAKLGQGPATAPATPPPAASASVNVPQPHLPSQVPATAVNPATTPNNSLVPNTSVNLPNVPGLPVPLPQQVSFPGDLTSLLPGVPATTPRTPAAPRVTPGMAPGAVPGAVTTPAAPSAPSALAPTSGPMPDLAGLSPVSALP